MFIQIENLDDFLIIAKKYKCLKVFYVFETEAYVRIEAYAQTVKNTFYFAMDYDPSVAEEIKDILLNNDFIKVESVKTWEG